VRMCMCDCVCVCVCWATRPDSNYNYSHLNTVSYFISESLSLPNPTSPLIYTQYDVDVPYTSLLPQKLPYQRLAVDRRAAEREGRRLARVALLEEDEDEEEEEEEDEEQVRCRFVRTVLYCIVLYSTPL
jgi:hypothetical protein